MSHGFIVQNELSTVLQIHVCNGKKTLLRTDGKGSLPGQPRIQLQGNDFAGYIRKSHLVSELDRLAPYLRFVSAVYLDIRPNDVLNGS